MTGRPDVDGPIGVETVPVEASVVFGAGLPVAQRYADMLATDGVVRGLIGPREAPRLWTRHLLNCAVLAEALPDDGRVVDVGTGAGLPGVALACARADLSVDLVDTLSRRTAFLHDVVNRLDLGDRVRVVTGRVESAEVVDVVGESSWVVARAVAPLDRLVRWCLPLLSPGGVLLAMKGESAASELATHARAVIRAGGGTAEVIRCGVGVLAEPARVIRIVKS